jgi:tRNA/rRNA methyltransferase
MDLLQSFAFVLVRPLQDGNVGDAARALKNMGFGDLRLVAPQRPPGRAAAAMAAHADDVLRDVRCHTSVAEALGDRTLVVGTTCRTGLYRSGAIAIREAAAQLIAEATDNRVAFLFGPEDTGLTNSEIEHCQRLVTIPTAPAYPSLNLAQAVMLVAYELMMAADAARPMPPAQRYAPANEVEAMIERLARALVAMGFLPAENPEHIMFALRAMFGRAGLSGRDLDILNGIASQIRWLAEGGFETVEAKRRAGRKLR